MAIAVAQKITMQCSSLRVCWTNEIKYVIMRLESIVHGYTIRVYSGFLLIDA